MLETIIERLENLELECVVKLELRDAGTKYLRLDGRGSHLVTPTRPDVIIRGRSRDLESVLEGGMNVSAALLTARLELAGEARLLSRVAVALSQSPLLAANTGGALA